MIRKIIPLGNNPESFVALWQLLERTRIALRCNYRRFCLRNILKAWFPSVGCRRMRDEIPPLSEYTFDDLAWTICSFADIEGYTELPRPADDGRKLRDMLCIIVALCLGIGVRSVWLNALDDAYSTVFPHSTPLNIDKRRHLRHQSFVASN
ncbi:MAG: hypothetical protein KBS94_03605 [Prevotella sp.]|nr:hypothetical protein [Candidatus Equicola faecalis]MDO4819313.1 hypothetical protein [Prevotella sp.]